MTTHAPRCPFCANVLKLQPSFWERFGLKSSKARCPTCQRGCDSRDAHIMGDAYGRWAETFRKELTEALGPLPILPEPAMDRALGKPHRDDTRLISSVDELVRTCMRHHRSVLIEMARGREVTLEVVHLLDESTNRPEAAAILSVTSAESGSKELEQLIARHGLSHFVLYNYPTKLGGAEPRVKRAIHAKPQKHPPHSHSHPATTNHAPHATHPPAKHAHPA